MGDEKADVSVVNTCIVTQRASHQSRQAIRKAIRENPAGMVAAVGCYAQVFPDELSEIPGIGVIADNTAKGEFPNILLSGVDSEKGSIILRDFKRGMPFECLETSRFPGRTRAHLKIQDGCESFCSYCIVPFARGPCRSLPQRDVLRMMASLSRQGYKEVVLTGIHLGKYGIDLKGKMTLNRLLLAIGRECFPVRIRLSSIEPNEIDEDLIEMVAAEPGLCRHFHIPLQSGDNEILKKMNRNYTARAFEKLIESIYTRMPLGAIGADVMAGFPGEELKAYENTCALIKDLPVSYLHVFPFSPRPGTAAATFDGRVDPTSTKERAEGLRDIGQRKRNSFYRSCLGTVFQVLAETWNSDGHEVMKGTSDNYLPVSFRTSKEWKNELIAVRMESVEDNRVIGSAL
jgi:threonylcarbamoyladenosine tRNA methylthiotransferase MtaB